MVDLFFRGSCVRWMPELVWETRVFEEWSFSKGCGVMLVKDVGFGVGLLLLKDG